MQTRKILWFRLVPFAKLLTALKELARRSSRGLARPREQVDKDAHEQSQHIRDP